MWPGNNVSGNISGPVMFTFLHFKSILCTSNNNNKDMVINDPRSGQQAKKVNGNTRRLTWKIKHKEIYNTQKKKKLKKIFAKITI